MQLIDEKKPRILVLCNGHFALPAIRVLAFEKYLCGIGVGDAEDDFNEYLSRECEEANLPFRRFSTINSLDKLPSWIKKLAPDYIYSICFPFRLSKQILEYKEKAFINFHTGPLPEFRGPMPIFEVIRRREKYSALSVHYMDMEFDEGPIIFEEKVFVENEETFGSLAVKMSELCGLAAKNLTEMLQFATFVPSREQERKRARYYEKPSNADLQINWNFTIAEDLEALIRASDPWNTGVRAMLSGELIRIIDVALSDHKHGTNPGQFVGLDGSGRLLVSCLNGECLAVKILQSPSGFFTGSDYFNKYLNHMENVIE